jgi:hypothetical protein
VLIDFHIYSYFGQYFWVHLASTRPSSAASASFFCLTAHGYNGYATASTFCAQDVEPIAKRASASSWVVQHLDVCVGKFFEQRPAGTILPPKIQCSQAQYFTACPLSFQSFSSLFLQKFLNIRKAPSCSLLLVDYLRQGNAMASSRLAASFKVGQV